MNFQKATTTIKDFEYKESVEKERPLLTAEPRLITIDGVDGLGKSTIAKKLANKLCERFGEEKIILASATKLIGSPKQDKLGVWAKRENISYSRLETIYIAGVNRAYEEVIIPALKDGKIVVVDRSEVDLLRYALWRNDEDSFKKRLKYIKDGTVTHHFLAGNRIFLESNANDVIKNLTNREHKSSSDPQSLEEVEANINAQKEAEKQMELLPYQGKVNVTREEIMRVENESLREIYLNEVVEKLFNSLDLSDADR